MASGDGGDGRRWHRRRNKAPPRAGDAGFSQSLARGLELLACFTAGRSVLGISDLADVLGLSRATTHRYARTLLELGYLEQRNDRRYRLGLGVTDLGLAAVSRTGLRASALADQQRLRERTRLACGLAALDGPEVVYLERLPGYDGAERENSHRPPAAGSRLPAYRTAAGKILLAYLSEAEREQILKPLTFDGLGSMGDETRRLLSKQFRDIADDGVAVNDGESTRGILAIAAPVRDGSGEVIAALNLIASRPGLSIGDLLDQHNSALQQTAQRISGRFGYQPS